MRLTLRTLLAYLDDILEPSQTKEIGNKLAESKFASDLVERIREVMRRRRLTAPDIDGGDGLDANVVSEYLDNTLPPEKVTDVEKRCLESDIHLAEAAACHQILTLVLGEPVEITPDSRRRMYGLVSQGSGDNQAAAAAGTPANTGDKDSDEIPVAAAALQEKEQTETIGSSLPDYLKPRPVWRRALPIFGVALAISVFFVLIVTDQGYNNWLGKLLGIGERSAPAVGTPSEVANRPQAETGEPANANPSKAGAPSQAAAPISVAETSTSNDAAKAVGGPGATRTEEPAGQASKIPGAGPAGASPDASTAQNPSVEKKMASQSGSSPTGGEVGKAGADRGLKESPSSTTAVALVAPRPMPATAPSPVEAKSSAGPSSPKPPADLSPPAPPAEPAPEIRLSPKTGVLLGYDSARDDWFVLERPGLTLPNPNNSPPDTVNFDSTPKVQVPSPPAPMATDRHADQLVAPEPFDNVLELGDGLCRVWVLGGTSVRLLAPTSATRFGIELREGKIVIRSGGSKLPGTDYKPLVVAFKMGDEVSQITFLRPETQCGLEIVRGFPTKPGEDARDTSYRGALYVVSGDIRLTESVGRQRTLSAGRGISLAPSDRAVATDMNGFAFRAKGGSLLSWLNPDSRRVPAALAKVTRDFEADFMPDQPVSASIATVAKNERNPVIAELAAKTLALTNQYSALVEVLVQVPHEEAVHAAANGLRAWLPLAPDHAALLQKELVTAFPPGPHTMGTDMDDRAIVLRLLWGYNSDDARDRKTSNQLVEWLGHDRLAVRLLAIDQIRELTGQNLHFRAGMPAGDRKRIKKDWERYVERSKGLLPQ
jgi:hypothetical protein